MREWSWAPELASKCMYDIPPLLHINITGGALPTRIAAEANNEQKQDFQRLLGLLGGSRRRGSRCRCMTNACDWSISHGTWPKHQHRLCDGVGAWLDGGPNLMVVTGGLGGCDPHSNQVLRPPGCIKVYGENPAGSFFLDLGPWQHTITFASAACSCGVNDAPQPFAQRSVIVSFVLTRQAILAHDYIGADCVRAFCYNWLPCLYNVNIKRQTQRKDQPVCISSIYGNACIYIYASNS
ncbi:hypothetical protein BJ166DRAFT_255073 [Pestalotiopsis sp. NC0098]|nr:hypothetical protein BJ166DRAFT_255073 [Pestalotiopsis sp. NC0098]